MFARSAKSARIPLLIPLICLAACAGNGNPSPTMPNGASVPAFRNVAPAPRPAGPATGTTFYVNGLTGSNKNDCKSPQRACKTIQEAVHVSAPGDTIDVAAAVYNENVQLHHSVTINGAGRN
ncbi:MAG: hypothetical protein JO263_04415, partial [Candidatus Eremiobacteraeota bacterium]|nr:hypothetical protein [Candidatus Eremiobacteraeota bacterium]